MGKFFDIAGFRNPAKGCMGIALLFVCSALFSAEVKNMPPVASAKVPETKHVFSMSCKVTAVNGDLASPDGRVKCAFAIEDGSPVVDVYGNIMKPKSLDRLVLTESPIYVIGSFRPLRSDTARATKGEK